MNVDVQLSLWHSVFNFFWYIPQNGNTGSYGGSSFNFLKNFQTVFHSVCSNLHFHQECMWGPFSPHSLQHLLSLLFLMIILVKWWGNLLWFWHAFLLWLLILSIFWCMCWPFIYLLWNMSIQVLYSFFNQIIWIYWGVFAIELYKFFILDINSWSDVCFADVFHLSTDCHFILLIVSFVVQRFLVRCSSLFLILLLVF